MEFDKHLLVLLFDRPTEPHFVPKGDNLVMFTTSPIYLTEKYQNKAQELNQFYSMQAKRTFLVKDIDPIDLTEISQISRNENFTPFITKHLELAGKLVKIFMECDDLETLLQKGIYARERVNPYMFNYAWSVTLLHHPQTKDVVIPSLITVFPDKFVPNNVMKLAREETNILPDDSREVIYIPSEFTASRGQPEHRLAYFREDLGINLHHWHWHMVYPNAGFLPTVKKDRRGELFYHMHRQMVARYNFERLCNSLGRVDRFIDFRKPIANGYYSKLTNKVAGQEWPGRVEFQRLHNVDRPKHGRYDINDLERCRHRIYSAIHLGHYIGDKGEHIKFNEETGIDVLGNMVESSILSPNKSYYGDLHNTGHVVISAAHDPQDKHLEELGVMSDTATAVRDPVFFEWHAFIDDVFQEYKKTLPPYTYKQLSYEGVRIDNVFVNERNTLETFWEESKVDVNHGLDFAPRGNTIICFKHLNHKPFEYKITVSNKNAECWGTCRIYMSPKFDEAGHPWLFNDQRLMMIELDRFVVKLKKGSNTFIRKSTSSSITIPFDIIFASISDKNLTAGDLFCSCGWPEYMLIPKGTQKGFPCELFVMISNYQDDKVEGKQITCEEDAFSFCGVKEGKYPDKRPLGFPFDRNSDIIEGSLKDFCYDNMYVKNISIQLRDEEYFIEEAEDENEE